MTFAEARHNAGLTMEELAGAAGVTPAAICRYEHGQRTPKTAIAKRLASVLGVEWYELIDNDMDGNREKKDSPCQ